MDIKLGRLRQWAGEVISSREKTSINEEFSVLEKDIELRKDGINRLILASEKYHYTLSKKKTSQALREEEKLLPIDILGIVMIQHGEQFGEDSIFGNSLVKLGSAHSQIATIQEAYALTFKDTFLASMEKFRDEIKEYELLRKKLDSRKSVFDSATAKFEKIQNSKKEKDKIEAEDEMERAKQRYEETVEDLRAHIHAIQENEHSQLHELTTLVDVEFNFVQNYLNILKDVKAGWQDQKHQPSRNRNLSLRSLPPARSFAHRSNNSTTGIPDAPLALDSSDEGDTAPSKAAESRHRSNSNGSRKAPSRPTSRLSRRRTNSGAASSKEGHRASAEDKEEKEKSRRSMAEWASSAMESVTGGKSKKPKLDRESFSALEDSSIGNGSPEPGGSGAASKPSSSFLSISRLASKTALSTSNSKESLPIMSESSSSSSQTQGKIMKPQSMQGRKKVVRAVYDFNGSSDELSFKAGTEIVVLNEVLDDWWIGEVDGQTGMFPISYTEAVRTTVSGSSLPSRSLSKSPKSSNSRRASLNGRRSVISTPKHLPIPLPAKDNDTHDKYLISDTDDDDTRDLGRLKPMTENAATSMYLDKFDNDSESLTIDESEDSEKKERRQQLQSDWITFDDGSDVERPKAPGTQWQEDQQILPPSATPKQRTMSLFGSLSSSFKAPILDPAQQPLISRSKGDNSSILLIDTDNAGTSLTSSNQARKAPPPPPPRRPTQIPTILPPIPKRKVPSSGVSSGNTSGVLNTPFNQSSNSLGRNESSSGSDVGYDRSPFESALELGLENAGEVICDRFRQNPFKPKGMCSNCLQLHEL